MMEPTADTRHKLLEDLSTLTVKTSKQLETTRQELAEKELQLLEIANVSHQKIKQAAKTNSDLKQKVDFFQELCTALNEKNEKLERALLETDIQKSHYLKLVKKYKKDLEKLVEREKDLEIHRSKLSTMVEQKSQELLKAERIASVVLLSTKLSNGLRSPLNIIKNSTALLQNSKKLVKDDREKVTKIEKASRKVAHQLDDVLEFVSNTELFLKRHSIDEIISVVIKEMNIPDTVKIDSVSCDGVVNIDYKKMKAVFTNILGNAVDAMNEKGEIIIKTIESEMDVLIRIRDSGPGIGKSNITKIFDPLFSTKENGTGLGLSITKNIIEQHGGSIKVTSPPTTFEIYLPKNLRGFYKASDAKLT